MAVDNLARALSLAASSGGGDTTKLEESINTLKEDVSTLETNLENNTNNLQTNIDTLENNVDTEVSSLRQYVDEKVTAAVMGDGITNIVQLTKAQYDDLEEKDSKTLYLILG